MQVEDMQGQFHRLIEMHQLGLTSACIATALPSTVKQATPPDSNFLDQLEKIGQ